MASTPWIKLKDVPVYAFTPPLVLNDNEFFILNRRTNQRNNVYKYNVSMDDWEIIYHSTGLQIGSRSVAFDGEKIGLHSRFKSLRS